MPPVAIPFLVKVFKQEAHARNFMNGEIYSNPLSYFRGIEDDARQDKFEGALLHYTPDMKLSLWPDDPALRDEIGTLHLRRNDLAEPLAMFPNGYRRFNLFSMYAKCIHEDDTSKVDEDHLVQLKKMFEVPAALSKFGRHAVVISKPRLFVERVKGAAVSQGYRFGCGVVEYQNPEEGWPVTDPLDPRGIFIKRERYAEESEYRMVFGRRIYSDAPIKLQIGDISDIAYRAEVSSINDGIQVSVIC